LFFEACRIIGVTRASILTLVDPLLAALIAIIFLDQFLTGTEWAGCIIILMALVLFEMKKQAVTSR
jgi:drug/metabolite transporter (DMT)-like permease